MSDKIKIQFIVNPVSGHAKVLPYSKLVADKFNSHEYETQLDFTNTKGHAGVITKRAISENFSIVVAVGGDGTINEVANALINSDVALAIIPKGSGNGLALHHKIPVNFNLAMDVIKSNHRVKHDAVHINEYTSFNVSGIGFDAHIAHLFGKNGNRGFSSYCKLTLQEFNKYKNHKFKISNGNTISEVEAALVSIANASQFGNGAVIAPDSLTNDGITDITALRKMSFLKLPSVMWRIFNKSIAKSPHANVYKGKNFVIKSEVSLPLHVDGEIAGFATEFTVNTIPDAITLIIP